MAAKRKRHRVPRNRGKIVGKKRRSSCGKFGRSASDYIGIEVDDALEISEQTEA